MYKSDRMLENDVKDELDWDPLLDSTQIVVKVRAGRVTLTGAVPSYYDVLRATQGALSVHGVRAVDNEILIGLIAEVIADDDLAAVCAAAIDAERWVPKGAVVAEVQKGWVTLTGAVRCHYQRQAAERAVNWVDGVRGVANHVVISGGPAASDLDARDKHGNKASEKDTVEGAGPPYGRRPPS